MKTGEMIRASDRVYVVIVHQRRGLLTNQIVERIQLINPRRQFKKSLGLSGRQWTRYRKEMERESRVLPPVVSQ